MAQLVEHIVHIDGVTGSSPVATTKNPWKSSVSEDFLFAQMNPVSHTARGTEALARMKKTNNPILTDSVSFSMVASLSVISFTPSRCERDARLDVNGLLESTRTKCQRGCERLAGIGVNEMPAWV